MTAQSIQDPPGISLITLPPSPRQTKLAIVIVAILVLAFVAALPFALTPLPRLNAFIPTIQAIVLVTDLITAVLLFGHFAVLRTRSILVVANAYLFSALIVLPYGLAFPGAFGPGPLFGDLNTAVWLYVFWHIGFPAGVLAYACLKAPDRSDRSVAAPTPTVILASMVVVAAVVAALTLIAAHADSLLPHLFATDTQGNWRLPLAAIACSIASAAALALLWWRRNSILDLWLMVALCAGVTEPLLTAVPDGVRFSLGFYASRGFSVVTSTVVLAALLSEMTILYASLSRNIALLQRERRNRLMNVEAVVASIKHEIRQPLSAIAANGSAALMFLDRPNPDLDEAREALNAVLQDSFNASQMFDGIRALFRSGDQEHRPVDLNDVALSALGMLRGVLRDHRVAVSVELEPDLPSINGHRVQLQEVVLNLVHNAVDAMDLVADRPRLLRVRTRQDGRDAVMLSVEDSGPGIEPGQLETIFDPFVTTKAHGMGLGLAICRMIVERHGGRISAPGETNSGAVFQVNLPFTAGPAPTHG